MARDKRLRLYVATGLAAITLLVSAIALGDGWGLANDVVSFDHDPGQSGWIVPGGAVVTGWEPVVNLDAGVEAEAGCVPHGGSCTRTAQCCSGLACVGFSCQIQ